MKKPSIPKGTRDFSPNEVMKRNYIMDTVKGCFTTFGFQPIETPSFENSDTLMGKYGEEGDRLIFKILDSGDYFSKAKEKIINLDDRELLAIADLFEDLAVLIRSYAVTSLDLSKKNRESMDLLTHFIKSEIEDLIVLSDAHSLIQRFVNDIVVFFKERSFWISADMFFWNGFFTDDDRFEEYKTHTLRSLEISFISILRGKIIEETTSSELTKSVSEKALRYDLTVPFARYVVQHQNDITFPFKRYQIQPVWRADRPQKGRFREFYQCDADVVGSKSLWQEVEFVKLYDTVFTKLKLTGVSIKMNNRKILSGIAEVIGEEDKLIDFTVALDKLDKIGEEGVIKEMLQKGISETAIEKIKPLFTVGKNVSDQLALLESLLASSEIGKEGISELSFIVNAIENLQLQTATLEIDVTLARGLNYYTGAIFEVAAPSEVKMGSIGGGGRYDDLTGIFGLKDMSGVGISFGLDRIYLVLEELNLFPETVSANTKVLFINFGENESLYAMKAITKLRNAGVAAELYPDQAKMGKQMGYADKRDIPFTVLAGEKEMETNRFTIKNMKDGVQDIVTVEELIERTL